MSLERIGIIGCGHLAGFLCAGLRHTGWRGELFVTSHRKDSANRFAHLYGAKVVTSRQEVVTECRLILLSVRPDQYQQALQDLAWSPTTILLSVLAGVPIASLQQHAQPATIIRAMPISAAAINQSPTPVYPGHPIVSELFNLLGSSIELPDEQQFTVATANAAAYGWILALIAQLEAANSEAGLSSAHARQMVTQTLSAAAAVAADTDGDLNQLLSTLATPGGITAEGYASLQQRRNLEDWREVFLQIVHRLKQ